MRDMLTDPLWRADDLGKPIPDSLHAVSVCLPTWADNVGYEEGEPRVVDRMATGYPRFVHHPMIRQLFAECVKRFAKPGETCIAFPSRHTAELCQEFLYRHGIQSGLNAVGANQLFAVNFGAEHLKTAKYFWQHTGAIVSSRLAEATLQGRPLPPADEAWRVLTERLAGLTGAAVEDVLLFPSGMAAIHAVYRALQAVLPDRRCVQFGFPYTDTIKIQQKFGKGVHFLAAADEADYERLAAIVGAEPLMGLFCEFPSNPLLLSPDLGRLAAFCRQGQMPLVVDDTIGSFANVDVLPAADVLVSSLTKLFSGAGDVMGGLVALRGDSPWHDRLSEALRREYEQLLCSDDAIILEENSRDYAARAARAGATAEVLGDILHAHPAVERLWYPKHVTPANYASHRRPGGTYSTLFSLLLKDPSLNTAPFFDALRVCKGPNLGTNFTLACPYTLLAHYPELAEVEALGVSRYLIRVSVGQEEPADLVTRFQDALAQCDWS